MGVYALFLAGSNFLAPVFSGFIDAGQGWQWVLVGLRDVMERRTASQLTIRYSTGVQSSPEVHSLSSSS